MSDVFNGCVVRKLWRWIEHRPCGRLSCQAFFPQALKVSMYGALSLFEVGDCLARIEGPDGNPRNSTARDYQFQCYWTDDRRQL